MPYLIVKKGDEWCVFKHDEDNKPVGSSHGCHPSMEKAKKQMAALYVAEGKKIGIYGEAKAVEEFIDGYSGIDIPDSWTEEWRNI